jgi:hypothetical protein
MRLRLLVLLAAVAMAASAIAGPTASAGGAGQSLGRSVRAIPLSAPRPSWFTPELARQVHEAGVKGVALPPGVSVPASLAFAGIRPGAWIISPSGCTTNFVFGRAGNYHIGTAGHCAEVGDRVVLVALPGIIMEIGTTVKSIDAGIGNDFALIKVDAAMQRYVNPSISDVAGPTGVGNPQIGNGVLWSGHGLVIGTGGTPRAGIVAYRGPGEGGDAYGWIGPSMLGDSGSAVRLGNGKAAGNLTHLVFGTVYAPAIVVGTTAPRLVRLAGLPIATANLVPKPGV